MMRLVRLALPLAAVLLASPTLAATFEDLEARAQKVDALEPFLARYVGRCTDIYERATCERNVAAARREASGKLFIARVTDAATIIRPMLEGDRFTLLLTPFVDGGGGYALTHGMPARQDAAGRPVMGLIPIKGRLPPGTMEMEFQRPFRSGAVELEVVFTPEKTWKMKRKGEAGHLEGVAARFLGVRVLDANTGKEIASRAL
jgi:hypothetical protein